MQEAIFADLQSISYGGTPLTPLSHASFVHLLHSGLESTEFSHVIQALCKQLRLFVHLHQDVNEMRSVTDSNAFLMDVSSFLEELECPYKQLTTAALNERLGSVENRLLLMDFLIGEIQAARLSYLKNGPEERLGQELSSTGTDLKKIVLSLGLAIPPSDIDSTQLFASLESKLKETLGTIPQNLLGQPLLTSSLTPEQWKKLELINDEMSAEYRLRREMLLKRFDVTVQSFSWSEKAKTKEAELKQVYLPRRKEMPIDSTVTIADILAARDDLLHVEKTSSHSVRKYTQCSINRLVMGDVPDRGGRTDQSLPSFPDMPGFRPREGGSSGNRGGGFGQGDFRGGGRVQHGFGRGGHRGRH